MRNIRSSLEIKALFEGKRVLVMGLGLHGGGVSAIKFLAEKGALITVTDLRNRKQLRASLRALAHMKGIRYALGKHDEKDIENIDLIVKNPGVKPDAPFLLIAQKLGIPILSDIAIFFAFCPATIVGVTGTRGKSTTAYLIWKFLKIKKKQVFLGGNIRKSPLDFLERVRNNDIVVLELSSFQLSDLSKENRATKRGRKSPHIAVLTNIFRDHLNWHKNMEEYIAAKQTIVAFQKKGDHIFANPDDLRIRTMIRDAPGQKHFPRLAHSLQKIVEKRMGAHYESSVALAAAVAEHFNVSLVAIKSVLERFKGLPGRQEYVGRLRGIHVINDTTATVPDATIAALKRFRPLAAGRLILIAGGQDKELDFREFVREIKKSADALILLPGTATEKIKKELGICPDTLLINSDKKVGVPTVRRKNLELGEKKNYHVAGSMRDAIQKAFECAQKGDYIIFSPGAASFGLFLNEYDRGEQFVKEIVGNRV